MWQLSAVTIRLKLQPKVISKSYAQRGIEIHILYSENNNLQNWAWNWTNRNQN